MKEMQTDLKELQKSNNEMDVKSEMGYKDKDMYISGYLDFLQELCEKYNIAFNKEEIDWEWCNYIHNKQWELENKIKQSINTNMISNDKIVVNMTPDEKFTVICRIKDINIDEMTESIIRKIKDSDIEEKDEYTYKQEVWDSEYVHIIAEYDRLYIDESLTWSKDQALEFFQEDLNNEWELGELWIELAEEEKNFIRLALQCKVRELKVEMM
jgi:HD-GYP domain-containing protein (c-di-GMP phosphodiesterase class II)